MRNDERMTAKSDDDGKEMAKEPRNSGIPRPSGFSAPTF
jgi:hypothetical protein